MENNKILTDIFKDVDDLQAVAERLCSNVSKFSEIENSGLNAEQKEIVKRESKKANTTLQEIGGMIADLKTVQNKM
jgi:hypothetical protein